MRRDFYVDDGLKSVKRVHTTIDLIKNCQAMCARAGLTDRRRAKQHNLNLEKCSSLYRLDPHLDANDIIHVGGRLRRANMPEVSKHPVIITRRSHITNLILQYCHQVTKHQGSDE